jgi:hypothetical protein
MEKTMHANAKMTAMKHCTICIKSECVLLLCDRQELKMH